MAELKRLSRNFTIDFVGRYLIFFLTGINGILLARWLEPELLGEWGLFAALAGTGGTLATLGFHYSLPRRLARQLKAGEPVEPLLAQVLRLKLGVGLALGAGLALLSPWLVDYYGGKLSLAMALLGALFLFVNGVGSFANPLFVGAKQIRNNYLIGVPLTLVTLGLTSAFFGYHYVGDSGPDRTWLVGYTLAYTLINLAFGLAAVALIHSRLAPVGLERRPGLARELLAEGVPFMGLALVLGLYDQLFVFVIASYHPREVVGLFVASFGLMRLLRVVPQSFNTVMLPLLAERTGGTERGEGEDQSAVYRTSQALLALAGGVAGLTLVGLAQPVVDLLLGAEYSSAGPLLRLLGLVVVVRYCAQGMFPNLMAAHQERKMMVTLALGLLAGGLVAAYLVPGQGDWRGAQGAAVSYLVAEGINLALLAALVAHGSGAWPRPLPLLVSLATVAVGYLYLEPRWGLAGVLAGLALFVPLAWWLLLTGSERRLVGALVRAVVDRDGPGPRD